MSRRSTVLRLLRTLLAFLVIAQSGVSLALTVNEGWHEAVHHHHGDEHSPEDGADGEDGGNHDCPVVQLAHGFWDTPEAPIFAVPRPPVPSDDFEFPDTARTVPAFVLLASVLEHAPPRRG